MPALGNRLKPMRGTSARLPANSSAAASNGQLRGWASARSQHRAVGALDAAAHQPEGPVAVLVAGPADSKRLARNGMTVSDTSSEAAMVNTTASGSCG